MRGITTAFFLLLIVSLLNGQRTPIDSSLKMDFELYDPPTTLVVPQTTVTKAKFPFVDCHSHHWRMATQDLDKLIREMDTLNMGMIVNLSGRGGPALAAMMDNVKNTDMRIASSSSPILNYVVLMNPTGPKIRSSNWNLTLRKVLVV